MPQRQIPTVTTSSDPQQSAGDVSARRQEPEPSPLLRRRPPTSPVRWSESLLHEGIPLLSNRSRTSSSSSSSPRSDTPTPSTTSSTEPNTNGPAENDPSQTRLEQALRRLPSTSQPSSSSSSSLTSMLGSTTPSGDVKRGWKLLNVRCPSCMSLLQHEQDETSARNFTDELGRAYLLCGPCPRCG